MKPGLRASVGCSVCGHTIAATSDMSVSPEKLAAKAKAASITIKAKDGELRSGWLCRQCEQTLLSFSHLRRVVKTAYKSGNSGAVIVPYWWVGLRVAAYLLEPGPRPEDFDPEGKLVGNQK